jgi:DNA repair exonuclease SbcCD nuclease subunit
VRIIHTADVHLSPEHPGRMEALEQVVDLCEQEDADLLLITGDLFDANVDLEDLKTDLRPLFSENSFQTLVIPGNHDKSAFRQEDYFGEDLEVLQDKPYSQKIIEDLNIVAVPYTNKAFSELVKTLSEALEEDKENILMIHCTLAGATGGFGEESEYLPVKPSELVQTGYDYVLAGHIHSSATRKTFGNTVFAYSGSPVSISSNETGKREAWLLETGEGLETKELDTEYYLREKKEVLPGEEDEVTEEIRQDLKDKDLDKASVIVEVEGFTEEKVEEFSEEVQDRVEGLGPADVDVEVLGLESASSVMDSEIYREFRRKMEEKDFGNPDLVEKKFLRGLSRYER